MIRPRYVTGKRDGRYTNGRRVDSDLLKTRKTRVDGFDRTENKGGGKAKKKPAHVQAIASDKRSDRNARPYGCAIVAHYPRRTFKNKKRPSKIRAHATRRSNIVWKYR